MKSYDPPYKTMFFVCYSTVAAIVATEAGLLGDSDSLLSDKSHDKFVLDNGRFLAETHVHPWCGTFDLGEAETSWLQTKAPSREVQETKGHRHEP